MAKSIFLSKTFWVNVLSILVTVFNQDFLTGLGLSPQYQIIVLGVINLILRLITTQPVEILPSED